MIPWEDVRFETWPPRQVGGQQVGPGPQGVKATHIPTDMTAFCNWERSQHRNRQIAMDMLVGGLTSPAFRGRIPQGEQS